MKASVTLERSRSHLKDLDCLFKSPLTALDKVTHSCAIRRRPLQLLDINGPEGCISFGFVCVLVRLPWVRSGDALWLLIGGGFFVWQWPLQPHHRKDFGAEMVGSGISAVFGPTRGFDRLGCSGRFFISTLQHAEWGSRTQMPTPRNTFTESAQRENIDWKRTSTEDD